MVALGRDRDGERPQGDRGPVEPQISIPTPLQIDIIKGIPSWSGTLRATWEDVFVLGGNNAERVASNLFLKAFHNPLLKIDRTSGQTSPSDEYLLDYDKLSRADKKVLHDRLTGEGVEATEEKCREFINFMKEDGARLTLTFARLIGALKDRAARLFPKTMKEFDHLSGDRVCTEAIGPWIQKINQLFLDSFKVNYAKDLGVQHPYEARKFCNTLAVCRGLY